MPIWAMLVLGAAGVMGWVFIALALIPNAWLEAWLVP
jgi:hypothetical protein